MSKFLKLWGLALRDGVYETFMEVTKTTDLKELKEAGFRVDEYRLDPDGVDKLYVLVKNEGNMIKTACTLSVKHTEDGPEPEVKVLTSLETQAMLKRLQVACRVSQWATRAIKKSK